MTRSLEDPTFAGRVESVDADLVLPRRVRRPEHRDLPRHGVRVPRARADRRAARLPRLHGARAKTVEDIRHVTAVEGTELTLLCRLNKDVASARLVDEKGQAIAARRRRRTATTSTARRFTLADSQRYRVQLVDREGRPNKLTAEIVRERHPEPAAGRHDDPARRTTSGSRRWRSCTLKAEVDDDFGVVRHGLSYTLAGQEPREIVLTTRPSQAGQAGCRPSTCSTSRR